MKTTEKKLKKFFDEDELKELCKIGLLTCDTAELIIHEDHADLPIVNAGRPVYILDPNNTGIWGGGSFDGEYVGNTNIYMMLMYQNYPELVLDGYTEDFVQESGEMLFDGHVIIDPATDKKYVHSNHDYEKTCFPDFTVIKGTFEDTFFKGDDRTIFELFDAGLLVEVLVKEIYPITFPLKLSFDPNARYEDVGETVGVPVIEYIEFKAVNQSKKS